MRFARYAQGQRSGAQVHLEYGGATIVMPRAVVHGRAEDSAFVFDTIKKNRFLSSLGMTLTLLLRIPNPGH